MGGTWNPETHDLENWPDMASMAQCANNGELLDSCKGKWTCEAGDEFCHEFMKGDMPTKPRIFQANKDVTQGFTTAFVFDMSDIGYDNDQVAGVMDNTVTLEGIVAGNFHFTEDADFEYVNITGGKYTFTDPEEYGYLSDEYIAVQWDGDPTTPLPPSAMELYQYAGEGNDFQLDMDWGIYNTGVQSTYEGMYSPNR